MLCRMLFCCLLLAPGFWAQDSAGTAGQAPLGDVVRRQREQRQHSKAAKRVVTDDDIPANHMHWIYGQVAEYKIIPDVGISGLIPDDNSSPSTALGQKKNKIYIGFGPHLTEPDSCESGSFDCAEEEFIGKMQRGGSAGSKARILFDSDDVIQEYPARVAHFEVVHDVRGKMLGTVALIATPVSNVVTWCMFKLEDQPEAEAQCDTFISSLRVDVPKRYVNVEHH